MLARCVLLLGILLVGVNQAIGDDGANLDHFLEGTHSTAEADGLTFGAEYTGEVLANLSGGIKTGVTYEALLKISLNADLAKVLCWNGATLYGSMLYPHGKGLSSRYSGDLNQLSNIDAYNSVRLFELWFEQKFFGDLLSMRIGQMSADVEFFQPETSSLFINSCFGTFPTISFGTQLPIYPVGGLGARVDFKPISASTFRAALFDSNPGIQELNDKNGTRFHLSPNEGVIFIAEGVYHINPTKANHGMDGTYTLGGYYDSRKFTESFVHPAHSSNGGLYAIADQVVYRPEPYVDETSSNRKLSIFASCAAAPADRNLVSLYVDGGFNYHGLLPGRENDDFGIAISYTKLSQDVVHNAKVVQSGHETAIEATYRLQLTNHVFLQPDLQYILYPGGFGEHPNALVTGLRFDVMF
jgi:porin